MAFLDLFIKSRTSAEIATCAFSEKGDTVDYFNQKDDRSNPVTYQAIGRAKYGSGIPPTNYDTAVAAVQQYPVVYAVVSARAEAVAGLGIKIYDTKGGQEVEVKDHPFYQVFKTPNPYQGSFEFIEQVSMSLDVTGNAFIAIEPATAGTKQPFELYLIPTKYVAVIPDSKTKVKEYRYYVNGQSVVYKPEEMIHVKYNNIDDTYYGASPLTSAVDILTFEGYRIAFSTAFFKNGAIPVGVLETDSVLGDTLLKKLRGDWNAIHGGVGNSSKLAILQGGLKYRTISSPIKDLDLGNLKRLSREDILSLFKVPESVLGDLVNTSGSEGQDAIRAFWRQSLIPHLNRMESAINRGLKDLAFKSGKQTFRFNLKAVEALSDDKESVARYLSTLLSSSVMTPNEARAQVGLPPSTDPNADLLFISNSAYGNLLIPADQANNSATNNQEKPTTKPTKKPTKAKPKR